MDTMRIEMTASQWNFGIQKELRMVDQKIHEMVRSREKILTEASLHVIDAGGKRLRPTVTILSFKACGGGDVENVIDIAAGFELIHSATLIHDDINDGGTSRRGRETVYKKYGLHNAIVTGDFLFTKAFQLGGAFDKTVIETTARACASLAEGEVLQNRYTHRSDLTVDTYLKVIDRKTAQPIMAGATVGAYLAGAEGDVIESLGSYGQNLGIAFQIADDILDFTGDPEKMGKGVGTDLKEGHLTLPSLLAMRESGDAKALMLDIIAKDSPTEEEIRECTEAVLGTGAIGKAKDLAKDYGAKALHQLGCLSVSGYSRSLRDVVSSVLERNS